MNPSINYPESATDKLAWSLLSLRLGVGIVFAMWTIDKFLHPDHTAQVFEKFYMIPSLSSTLSYVIGSVQAVLVIGFLLGAYRTVTYGVIFLLHAVSTFSSYAKYLDPWTSPNLLFFAAFPMLAACLTLWLLREYDAHTIDGVRSQSPTTSGNKDDRIQIDPARHSAT